MMKHKLTMALPKGKLFTPAKILLERCGFSYPELSDQSRTLIFTDERKEAAYIICRPTDIPTYVEHGAADLGIVGKDSIIEAGKNLYELVDLKFGYCRFVVAVPQDKLSPEGRFLWQPGFRIATKFPAVAREYLHKQGLQAEIIKLHGNIELAPRVGLAEAIVDIVSTGRTLKENNLVPLEYIGEATARLIVNRASYRLKAQRINELVTAIKEVLGEGGDEDLDSFV
ncbi:MAG: ATP phosphoribosyltransferase [Clostridia bacterium]|nr:ATP phosphoribosyltransferase [Clostridia bacterium]MDD4145692.1 ATP phosphoribosyltransferase [Clostridia bacterium]MDD4665182.1 ATP phosphoribosyltransferase [Clostridia bacterium]